MSSLALAAAGLVGASSILACLRWPALGPVALIAGGLLVPFTVPTGTQTDLNFTVLVIPLLMMLWAVQAAHRRDARIVSWRPVVALIVFNAAAVLSLLVANQPWVVCAMTAPLRAQLGGLAVFVLSAGAFLLVADQVRDLRWLQVLTWLFIALGAAYIATRLVPALNEFTVLFQRGADGSLFWTWLVALAVGQAAFNRRLNVGARAALGGLILATFFVALTQSRDWASGWVPPLIAVLVTFWVGAPRLGALLTVIGGTAAAVKLPQAIALVLSADNQYSLTTRLAAWKVVAQVTLANPLFGLGPASYYHNTAFFPIMGWYVNFSSHNTYVDIIAQTGVVGMACFVWFIWELSRLGWRLRSRAPVGFAHAYVCGALGGLAGTLAAAMLGDWLLPFVYNVGLQGMRASVLGWLFLGGLVALDRLVAPSSGN